MKLYFANLFFEEFYCWLLHYVECTITFNTFFNIGTCTNKKSENIIACFVSYFGRVSQFHEKFSGSRWWTDIIKSDSSGLWTRGPDLNLSLKSWLGVWSLHLSPHMESAVFTWRRGPDLESSLGSTHLSVQTGESWLAVRTCSLDSKVNLVVSNSDLE